MTFEEYQQKAKTTAIYLDKLKSTHDLPEDIWTLLRLSYGGLGLGETGEVQGKIKKIIRDSGGVISEEVKQAIAKELGDILWYVSDVSDTIGISMDKIASDNIEKLFSRKERGVISGSGDNR